mmetsp:Transcript_98757/g.247517  ORF Transcript_98757/g.247517 Transcript_98757/m.247517 type:complete len:82 (-) Transcript_98757:406-651(-)
MAELGMAWPRASTTMRVHFELEASIGKAFDSSACLAHSAGHMLDSEASSLHRSSGLTLEQRFLDGSRSTDGHGIAAAAWTA